MEPSNKRLGSAGYGEQPNRWIEAHWPSGDAYRQFATQDLLDSVQTVLARYCRWSI